MEDDRWVVSSRELTIGLASVEETARSPHTRVYSTCTNNTRAPLNVTVFFCYFVDSFVTRSSLWQATGSGCVCMYTCVMASVLETHTVQRYIKREEKAFPPRWHITSEKRCQSFFVKLGLDREPTLSESMAKRREKHKALTTTRLSKLKERGKRIPKKKRL